MTHEKTNGEMEERKGKRETSSLGERKKERKRMMMMKTRHDRTHRRTQGNEENRKKRSSFYEAEGGFVTTWFLLYRWFTTYGAEATVPECQSNVPSETEPQL